MEKDYSIRLKANTGRVRAKKYINKRKGLIYPVFAKGEVKTLIGNRNAETFFLALYHNKPSIIPLNIRTTKMGRGENYIYYKKNLQFSSG